MGKFRENFYLKNKRKDEKIKVEFEVDFDPDLTIDVLGGCDFGAAPSGPRSSVWLGRGWMRRSYLAYCPSWIPGVGSREIELLSS